MPATLHFSNSLDALADRLIENLHGAGGDPFATAAIATPASALRDWLKVRIAEKDGIAANIAFPHLESLLWDRLAERDARRDVAERLPARALDPFAFQGLILAHLRRDPPPAIASYLDPGDAAEAARRLAQLSGRLAALFREYEYSRVAEHGRRALAESWMQGDPCFSLLADHPDVVALEQWQMAIYRSLFRRDEGLRDRWGAASRMYRYTLPQYAEMVLGVNARASGGGERTPPAADRVYHLFGLSNLSPFHRDLIGQLSDEERLGAAAARFEIYALNPCAEFWEDALTDRERQARARRRAPRRLPDAVVRNAGPTRDEMERGAIEAAPGENELLAQFGKPGRETIKLWCQLTGHDFHEDFRPPPADTLLATVRKSVLARLGPLPEPGAPGDDGAGITRVAGEGDDSLRLSSAPDARSELEAVRADMSRLLRADPDLRPEDLALIPADLETSLPLIRAVFAGGRDAEGNVPVLLPGADSLVESPLWRGFAALLSAGARAGDRNAVAALLENPAVLRATPLSADRLPAVRRFLEATGFQEGWGDEPGAPAASTARSAAERAVLTGVLDARDEAVSTSGFWPASAAEGLLDHEESAAVVGWLARLRDALRPFRDEADAGTEGARTWRYSAWAGHLRRLVDEFLRPEEDHAADKRAQRELHAFCAELGSWDLQSEPPERVAGALVLTLLEDAFRDPAPGRSAFLRGGVRVGGLSALRGLPFRHVWITGLAAGAFPAPGEAAPLDLRGFRRLPGESDPAARDLYGMLEVIASTSDGLALSWVRRDSAKDADVSPSRALTALKAWVDESVLSAGRELPVAAHPGRSAAASSAGAAFPAPAAGISWSAARAAGTARHDWNQLAEYLKNPAVHAARVGFGLAPYDALDFGEEERAAALFLGRRDEGALMETVRRAEMREARLGMTTFSRLWDERARGGLLPPPPYDALERERLAAEISGSLAPGLAALRAKLADHDLAFAGSLRVGPQDSRAAEPPVVALPAFDLAPLGIPAEVGGIFPWFFRSARSANAGDWAILVNEDDDVAAYVFDLCVAVVRGDEERPAAAAQDGDALPAQLRGRGHLILHHAADKSGNPEKAWSLHPLPARPAAEAARALRDLLDDIARGPRFDDLPLRGIESLSKDGGLIDAEDDWGEAVAAWRRDEAEKSFGGAKLWDRMMGTLHATVPADAGALVARRIKPYLDWKAAWRPSGKKAKPSPAADEATGEAEAAS